LTGRFRHLFTRSTNIVKRTLSRFSSNRRSNPDQSARHPWRRFTRWHLGALGLGIGLGLILVLTSSSVGFNAATAQSVRTGMTWTVVGQTEGYVQIGADAQTNAYAGDTTIDQALPILCVVVDDRPAPGGITFDMYNGWVRGGVQATPPIAATILTSQQQGDEICAEEFGAGWRLAEFHDGRYGPGFTQSGGWSFWAEGSLPAGTRFWVAINDQPANPWNSAGDIPATPVPRFFTAELPVPDQYIAIFTESTPETEIATRAAGLVSTYGGTILNVFDAVQGFSFNATEAQALAMSNDPQLESVDQDSYAEATQAQWHLDRVDQRNLPLNGIYAPTNNGSGVNIYILDSGFRRSHFEFGGRATQAVNFALIPSQDDCDGHGTHVGSLAGGATVGVAPGANLISVRIAGCHGVAYNPLWSPVNSTIVAGLNWVARYHVKPAVANVSYGARPGFWRRWFKTRSPIDKAARRAVQAGVTVIASAGNRPINAEKYSPARAGEVISVSGTMINDERHPGFSFGKVEIFAPGVDIVGAGIGGDFTYVFASGTSSAAPLVAGAAALYLHDHPTATPQQVRSALLTNATPGVVINPGPGSANRLLFVNPPPQTATHAGLTWTRLERRLFPLPGLVRIGADATSNPYNGDTPATTSLPVLCILVDGSAVPSGITPTFSAGWSRGRVQMTLPVPGSQLTSQAAADAICTASFGAGWRMAEFHDGRYGPNLQSSGGWSFWAYGNVPSGARFWTFINDQPANPWN
jgi:subtilisin family serine protease